MKRDFNLFKDLEPRSIMLIDVHDWKVNISDCIICKSVNYYCFKIHVSTAVDETNHINAALECCHWYCHHSGIIVCWM